MTHRLLQLVAVLASTAIAGSAPAQTLPPVAAGYGAIYRTMDVQTPTGNSQLYGVTFMGGDYYLSGTRTGTGLPHRIYRLTRAGALAGQFNQPSPHQASSTGMLGLATDGVSLIGGSDQGLSVFNSAGTLVNTLQALNGPQAISQPITANLGAIGAYRALAFDPNGNGGNGSILTGNLASNLIEINLAGVVLRTLVNPGLSLTGAVASGSGCGCAPWVLGDQSTSGAVEFNFATGVTGNILPARFAAPTGGMTMVDNLDPFIPWSNAVRIGILYRTNPRILIIQRIHGLGPVPGPGPIPWILCGDTEAFTKIGSNVFPLGRTAVRITPTTTSLNFKLESNAEPYLSGTWALIGLSLGSGAVTPWGSGILPEAVLPHSGSVPIGTTYWQFSSWGASMTSLALPPLYSPPNPILVQTLYSNPMRFASVPLTLAVTNSAYFY